jgi:hypothetical protein
MKQLFIKPDDIDIETFIGRIETHLGAKLIATEADPVVNGYFNTYEQEGSTYVVVVLYENDEPNNYREGIAKNIPYNIGHKSSMVRLQGDLRSKLNATNEEFIKLNDTKKVAKKV